MKLGESSKREDALRLEVMRCRIETALVVALAFGLEDDLIETSFESHCERQRVSLYIYIYIYIYRYMYMYMYIDIDVLSH